METLSAAALQYHDNILEVLGRIVRTQAAAIRQAACLVADTVARDGIVYAFGSGHSVSVAVELYFRAGGMACFDIIHDKTFGRAERLSGYAEALLDAYPVRASDLLIVISNSGRNALPVEMALLGRQRNLRVIGITSLAHSRAVEPRNPAGRLCEVCEVVIDNCGVPGDAAVAIGDASEGLRVGPTSTVAGAFIANCIVAAAAEELLRRGLAPPLLISSNVDEGDRRNEPHVRFIRERMRGL